ncbi:hypothetical protein J4210_05855 [Candidatus Woesearchaeota archaeon]|nr:hypothetical protein [Candidatus Woesearchaeota archaeon]
MNPLTVEAKIDPDFDCERFQVKVGNHGIFNADRYDKLEFSSVFWPVQPDRSKESYFNRLVSFYEELKNGGFKDYGERGFSGKITMLTNYFPRISLPLDYLEGAQPQLFRQPCWRDFRLCRVDTPYATFNMEDYSESEWKSETGIIGVLSRQDISAPLAGLISDTARYSAPREQLQPILAEKIYVFRNL